MNVSATAAGKDTQKLNGTLDAVVTEISRLHDEIVVAARTSVTKAIRIGELLYRVRASRRGKWLKWIDDNVPFLSQRTTYNYIGCYERRDELRLANVATLSDAYDLLCASTKHVSTSEQTSGIEPIKGIASDTDAPATAEHEPTPVSVDQTQAQRRHKSKQSILHQISTANLERGLKHAQIKIDKKLSDTIAQITRQSHATWSDFPARLIALGKALIEQGERLSSKT